MEIWRLDVGIATSRYGAPKSRGCAASAYAWTYGARELGRCAACVQTTRSSAGGTLPACRRIWRFGGWMYVLRRRGRELRRVGGVPQARMRGGMELESSGGALHACRRRDRAPEARCRRVDIER